MLNQLNRF